MAVRLESTIKRFVGSSADQKPQDDIPAGSSFLEGNTGAIFRWDGRAWMPSFAEERTDVYFQSMIGLLEDIREALLNL